MPCQATSPLLHLGWTPSFGVTPPPLRECCARLLPPTTCTETAVGFLHHLRHLQQGEGQSARDRRTTGRQNRGCCCRHNRAQRPLIKFKEASSVYFPVSARSRNSLGRRSPLHGWCSVAGGDYHEVVLTPQREGHEVTHLLRAASKAIVRVFARREELDRHMQLVRHSLGLQ